MKRNMDLIREILLEIEVRPPSVMGFDLNIENYSPEMVSYHVLLLHEAGLIRAAEPKGNQRFWRPKRLTWRGHEFLEASKDNARWSKVKEAMEGAGGFVVEVAKTLLIELMKRQVLPTP